MGVVITYEGCLDDPARLDCLIEAVKQRCHHLQWPCQEVDQHIVGEAYYFMGDQETPGHRPRFGLLAACSIPHTHCRVKAQQVEVERPMSWKTLLAYKYLSKSNLIF